MKSLKERYNCWLNTLTEEDKRSVEVGLEVYHSEWDEEDRKEVPSYIDESMGGLLEDIEGIIYSWRNKVYYETIMKGHVPILAEVIYCLKLYVIGYGYEKTVEDLKKDLESIQKGCLDNDLIKDNLFLREHYEIEKSWIEDELKRREKIINDN